VIIPLFYLAYETPRFYKELSRIFSDVMKLPREDPVLFIVSTARTDTYSQACILERFFFHEKLGLLFRYFTLGS